MSWYLLAQGLLVEPIKEVLSPGGIEFLLFFCIPFSLLSDGLVTLGEESLYCLETAQSPINIDAITADFSPTTAELEFEEYDLVNKDSTVLENNGHSIELLVIINILLC